ncbi:hypothetical protein OSJ57_17930 [Sphingomonas sp. HH69]
MDNGAVPLELSADECGPAFAFRCRGSHKPCWKKPSCSAHEQQLHPSFIATCYFMPCRFFPLWSGTSLNFGPVASLALAGLFLCVPCFHHDRLLGVTLMIACLHATTHRVQMDQETSELIMRVIARAPQWLRHDLSSKDLNARGRAEETLAAMIVDALSHGTPQEPEG